MQYHHDPATGRHVLRAAHAETAMGIIITRGPGWVWHVGKWPARIRRPSDALRHASCWHDAAYEDLPWTGPALALADAGFVVVYLRHGGNPALALSMWIALALWSAWTVAARTKPNTNLHHQEA